MKQPWQQTVGELARAFAESGITVSDFAKVRKLSRRHVTRTLLVNAFLSNGGVFACKTFTNAYLMARYVKRRQEQHELKRILDQATRRQEGDD